MKKLTIWGICFAVLMFSLNLIGCYDFIMVVTHNRAYFAELYTPAIKAYFTNYPIFFLILWIGNLLGGILTPIFYIFKNKSAVSLAGLAFWADVLLVIVTCLFRNRIQIFGWHFALDLVILCLIGIYYWYLRKVVSSK
ncbi:hypothetical protein [Streptococcus sobrinus]|uniref:Uncharacterized protein n=3 Tax=Streptococcus sobrinus TaxID=1310 RepID=U2KS77_9STRE|nr:hypothetical protein [Streptococcus sobrinus]AWN19447.1 hypothetical protein DK181_08355 [Streptococcus sobrinus]AWN21360.1 hypothetical protein DK182_08385 [Streptococcus sobrinus]AWN62185.1 hypothetical protein DLJ52_08345 [Streptococcus sobrinus]AWN64059.1 hypothetical protein DLJ51_08350 [Streptococcus sobrinus]EMP69526.1 hypothetical protein D823_10760 [Streptococcus sobrinus DSM 20742 = ATCC 33478]